LTNSTLQEYTPVQLDEVVQQVFQIIESGLTSLITFSIGGRLLMRYFLQKEERTILTERELRVVWQGPRPLLEFVEMSELSPPPT
jgi:hypothetical protein